MIIQVVCSVAAVDEFNPLEETLRELNHSSNNFLKFHLLPSGNNINLMKETFQFAH